jgi:hypothetical protein
LTSQRQERLRRFLKAVVWVIENFDKPRAEPPSKLAAWLRTKRPEFVLTFYAAVRVRLEGGSVPHAWVVKLDMAIAESEHRLKQMPGWDGSRTR